MKPAKDFEGCGSFNTPIRVVIEQELPALRDQLQSLVDRGQPAKNELVKAWLCTCLIKTIKEQVGL